MKLIKTLPFFLAIIGMTHMGLAEGNDADCPDCVAPVKKAKAAKAVPHVYPTFGSIECLDPAFTKLIPATAKIEKLAEGFKWSEGPVWNKKNGVLYFSDVPNNVVFQWKEGVGTREFLMRSGYTGAAARVGEPGSNGLTLDRNGNLVLCQHGDRQVTRLNANGQWTTLARYWQFSRFNSPNDLVYKSNGDLYFTDPPYGLVGNVNDPAKEINFSGVYRLGKKGEVTLLTSELSFPNGIAFSPDEKTLYVAVSDAKDPVIMAYPVKADGKLAKGKIFFDAAPLAKMGLSGLPDGLKVDKLGNLFATGPGGVLVISTQGKHLGTINTGQPTANCGWGDDGSTLYITANNILCRVKTTTRGQGF